jgi:hypothetical protein
MAYITCPQTKIKVILHYVDEGWLGRSTNKIDGVIFKYDPENDNKLRVQDVPEEDILARLSGPWREKVAFSLGPKPFVSSTFPVECTCLTPGRTRSPPRTSTPSSTWLPSMSPPRSSRPTRSKRQMSLCTSGPASPTLSSPSNFRKPPTSSSSSRRHSVRRHVNERRHHVPALVL